MSETKELALNEAAAIAEGKLSACLENWDFIKTPVGLVFLQKELQSAHDMLESARNIR